MFNKPIPNNLREYRQKSGFFQRDVALLLGLDCADRLSRWENGRAIPNILNLFKLAVLYKLDPHLLYSDLYDTIKHQTKSSNALSSSTNQSPNNTSIILKDESEEHKK